MSETSGPLESLGSRDEKGLYGDCHLPISDPVGIILQNLRCQNGPNLNTISSPKPGGFHTLRHMGFGIRDRPPKHVCQSISRNKSVLKLPYLNKL